jgi:hypothetical protein
MKSKRNLTQICLLCAAMLQAAASGAQALTFTNSTYTVGSGPVMPAVADVNGDGSLDLIIPISVFNCADPSHNSAGNTLVVLTNNGSGVFGSNATLSVGTGPIDVAAADVNGDGCVDLICANCNGNSWTVLTNNGSGSFGVSATLSDPLGFVAASFSAGDFSGDGCVDLICGTSGPGCSGGDN